MAQKLKAARYDITIEKGGVFDRKFTWKDSSGVVVDLTGYSANLIIHKAGTAIATYTSASELTLGGAAGTIDVALTATVTGAIVNTRFRHEWYLEVQSTPDPSIDESASASMTSCLR